ncbi:hypothetical protein SDJN02_08517 [Cucurbita argyrosperma subsp. argyrosperma]|nr:hypothetical protein SDJN02_08517 [Cucurbita argyrosperma subsp. argyrosperma]
MRHASKDLLCLERKDLPSSSLVLGRVKDFLGVLSEANKKLQLDAKDDAEKYDIEALNGDESEVIELDLMLGIADLHTPEAVAAAESAIIGNQPVIPLNCSSSSSSESESEESSDDSITSDNNDNDNEKSDNQNSDRGNRLSVKLKRSKSRRTNCRSESKEKGKSNKRPKILELS